MLKLSVKRFSFVLCVQCVLLLIDLGINSFSYLASGHRLGIILLFLAQDFCLVLAFTALLFSFHGTYVYQAGLAEFLFRKFRGLIIVLTLYFLLCVSHHVWILLHPQNSSQSAQWPALLTTLFIIQRMFSPVYYYLYKRSALEMSDPRFYDNMEWVANFLALQ